MLTKKDLNDIGSLIENKINPLDKRLSQVEKVVQKTAKDIKEMKEDLHIVKQDISYMSRTFDDAIIDTKRRVDRIDDHLHLPPLQTN